MKEIKLNQEHHFFCEQIDKKVRLVVSVNGEELACRRETKKKLESFLLEEIAHLFKGRLRLAKNGEWIEVLLKNEPIGIISSSQLKKTLLN